MIIRRPLYYAAMAMTAAIIVWRYGGSKLAAVIAVILLLVAWRSRQHTGWGAHSHKGAMPSGTGGPGGSSRLLAGLMLAAYLAGLGSMALCDTRLASDPALGHLEETVNITGIAEEPELYTDSRDRQMLRIRTRLLAINGERAGHSQVLVTVPAVEIQESAAGVAPSAASEMSGSGDKDAGLEEGTDAQHPADGAVKETPSSLSAENVLTRLPPGRILQCAGTLTAPAVHRNPGCFDYRFYLKTCGIQAILKTEQLQLMDDRQDGLTASIRTGLFQLREGYLSRLTAHAGEETSGFLRAVLFGQKSGLDEDIQDLFRRNGTAHILAVSGLHVGILYGALASLWGRLAGRMPLLFGQRKGRRFFLCMAVFFLGYAFLAGFAPSVVRAVCMVLLHAFAQMSGRRYDLHSAAFAVGMGALLVNPYLLFQTGFQMSFLAILTLGLLTPYLHRMGTTALAGSLAIQIGLGPYMIYQFNTLSLIAILINLPVIFLAGILVPAGMAGMVLPLGTGLYDQGLASLCKIMIRLNELACIDGISAKTVASPPLWMVAAFYLGLAVFASEEGRRLLLRNRRRVGWLLICLVLGVSLLFGAAADDGFRRMQLVFVDVGQGDCMHLRVGGRNFLIDGGGSRDFDVGTKTLAPYLLRNGVSHIDGAFVTHLHTDHYQGICDLAKAGMIRHLYVYEGNRVKVEEICADTGIGPDDITFLRQGQRVQLVGKARSGAAASGKQTTGAVGIAAAEYQTARVSEYKVARAVHAGFLMLPWGRQERSASLEVLWPAGRTDREYRQMLENEEDENASSLIMRVELGGVSLLATGDLGEEGEQALLGQYSVEKQKAEPGTAEEPEVTGDADAAYTGLGETGGALQVDVLKVGHHGSKTSSSEAFLDAVRPSLAVIQVGVHNMYGHPTPEVLQRLEERNIPVWRNDLQGAIGLKIQGGKIVQVKCVIQ